MRRCLLLLILAVAVLPAAPAAAATFTPTTTADGVNGACTPALCTLRDAVQAANAASGSTIDVPAGDYVLSVGGTSDDSAAAGDLDIRVPTTITGAGAGSTKVDAAGIDRVFELPSNNGFSETCAPGGPAVSISGLTITGGNATVGVVSKLLGGGGISACGDLTLTDVVIAGNEAIGAGGGLILPSNAKATLLRTTVSENSAGGTAEPGGGAILVEPSAELVATDSTVARNVAGGPALGAGEGAGILNEGTATLTNVTVTDNTAAGDASTGFGGGIFADTNTASTTVLNSTISSNEVTAGSGAGGGCGGNIAASQGCAAAPAGPFTIKNSIVAGGIAPIGGNCDVPITSQGHNIESADDCGFTAPGDQVNTDPKLGPLADNGGPTETRLPLAGSPAFDAGDDAGCPAADQRGIARPQAQHCDVGAVEVVPAADLAVAITATPEPVQRGGELTYTITVSNDGPQPATGVKVTDALPSGVTLLRTGGVGTCAGTPVVCDLPDLAAGASETVTLVVSADTAGRVENTATVSGTYGDPKASNDSATAVTTVQAPAPPPAPPAPEPEPPAPEPPAPTNDANLAVQITASPQTLTEGKTLEYTIVVTNTGPDRATGILLRDRLSTGVTFMSGRVTGAAGRGCTRRGTLLRCKLGSLASGASRRLRITVRTRRPGTIGNRASVSSPQTDSVSGDDRAVARVRVRPRFVAPSFTG